MQPKAHFTEVEYFEMQDVAPEGVKLEYDDGIVYCNGHPVNTLQDAIGMAGASPAHNLICGNIIGAIKHRLSKRGCRVYTSDQQVSLGPRHVFPDVVMLCNEPTYHDQRPYALTNPELLVEVLSPSTEAYDMTHKWQWYTALPSLMEYWMVFSTERRVLQDTRQHADHWMRHIVSGPGAVLRSDHFDLELPLSEVYDMVL